MGRAHVQWCAPLGWHFLQSGSSLDPRAAPRRALPRAGKIDMPKKLAITISGAVSLGSYEAGVLYEVLDAIEQHNSDPATDAGNRIEIDVLTGASAGGMTAIILAQKLLFGGGEFQGPYDNPVYNTWVKRISLDGLQNTGPDEPALHSLFSSNLITAISKEALTARYGSVPIPPAVKHPAAADSIRLGVALTNLNGVCYGRDVTPGGKFVYLEYGDQRTCLVDSTSDKLAFWEPMRQAAVACGAFPVAFRPQDIARSVQNEPDDFPDENLEPWETDPTTFTYSDGGILQNQPLGIAKNLVDLIDKHLAQQCRYYLFVSPNAKDPQANTTFRQADASYFKLIERLLGVVIGQSGFHDWITAEDMNRRVALLDARAAGLKDVILAAEIDVPALQTTASALLTLFFPNNTHTPPGATGPETLDEAKARIAAQYKTEIAALGASSAQAIAFRDAVLAFETAAGLGARDEMTIYGVTAMDTELAGAGLQAFLGFFDQDFRDHDYDVGRTHARAVLNDPALNTPGAIGPLRFTGKAIRPINKSLNGIKLGQIPAADLKQFKAGAKKRLNQMLRELGVPAAFLADVVADAVFDGVLDRATKELAPV